jgi:hypothetical protein
MSQRERHSVCHSERHTEKTARELNAVDANASQRGVKAFPGHNLKKTKVRCDTPCDVGAPRRTAYMRLDVCRVAPPRLGLRHSGLYVDLSRNVKHEITQRCDARCDSPCDTSPVTRKTHLVKIFQQPEPGVYFSILLLGFFTLCSSLRRCTPLQPSGGRVLYQFEEVV